MTNSTEWIDSGAVNPNLKAIREHFFTHVSRFFDVDGLPRSDFFEPAICYNCSSNKIASEFVVARFRHVRCAICGLVYVSPRIRENILHDSYDDEDYTEHYRLKLIPSLEHRLNVIDQRKYAQIFQYCKRVGKVLDIGCGLGDLLSVFQDNGWHCLGIEFNKFAAEFAAERFGLEVISTSIFDFETVENQFDCVMLWGVLEHFTHPQLVLDRVYRLLKPGGFLVMEVPSGDSLLVSYCAIHGGDVDRIIEGDRHLMLFSVRALTEMTERAGFQTIHLQSNGLDVDTLLRLEGESCSLVFVARLQKEIDDDMRGDLLRGFWRK